MKKLILALLIIASVMTACKTTEANYRAAYEIAKEKHTETGDSLTTQQLRNSLQPRAMAIGSDTLMVRTETVITVANVDKGTSPTLKKYCVVVAKFRQIFNARSMRQRLADNGYSEAVVLRNNQSDYYVAAGVFDASSDATALIERLKSDKSVVLRAPYPYTLRPTQLHR